MGNNSETLYKSLFAMKIAIVHDWLVTNAGAESVLKNIIDLYPNSDIYSLVDFLNDKDKIDILGNKKVKTTFIIQIQKIK